MLMLPLIQYDIFIIRPHLIEKFVGYLYKNIPIFKQISLHYSNGSIRNVKKFRLFYFFLHAFLIERFGFRKPNFSFVRKSISEFKIIFGQLIGFNVVIRTNYMYNFIFQYMYHSLHTEKGFSGLSLDTVHYNNFGSLNMVTQNIFSFPMLFELSDEFEEIFPACETYININILLSTKSIVCLIIYFSHLQFPLNDLIYYRFY